MRFFAVFGLAALYCGMVICAEAAEETPPTPQEQAQQAAELRQSVFKLMNWNMGPLAAMLRNRSPFDAAVAQKSALRLEQLAPMIPDVFQADTRKFQVKTKARESIWTNKSDFNMKADDLAKATAALSAAAKGGDKGTTLKAVATVGKACGACHDDFRDK